MRTPRLSLGTGLACLAAVAAVGCGRSAPSDEITVRRINIVDAQGEVRLVISGELPDTVWRGETHERSIVPAGIVWYDQNGDESGGLAIAPVSGWKGGAPKGTARLLTFDFTRQITDAVRLDTYESDDGNTWSGGLSVFDRRPTETGPVTSSQGKERVYLGTQNGDAGLVIRDAEERERIRIGVGRDGAASIEILSGNGELVRRFPEKG